MTMNDTIHVLHIEEWKTLYKCLARLFNIEMMRSMRSQEVIQIDGAMCELNTYDRISSASLIDESNPVNVYGRADVAANINYFVRNIG
jgi:hypothetical protein